MDVLIDVGAFLLGLVVLGVFLGAALYPFAMFVDVLRRPRRHWRAIDRSKAAWAAIVFFGSLVGAIAYAVTVRRDLARLEFQQQIDGEET